MATFQAKIAEFEAKAREKLELIVKQSAQDVFAIAQTPKAKGGRMPVDTGFLRNSFQAALNGSGNLTGPDAYALVISGMELGDTVSGGWTANYARFQEYGTANMRGNFYALGAAQQWQAIVAANVAKAT